MKPLVLTLAVLVCATAASAQVVTTSQKLARTTLTCAEADCESPIVVLSRHFSRGDMVKFQGYAAELLRTLARSAPADMKTALGDVNRNYYRLVWMCRDDSGAASLQSVMVHAGDTEAVRTLPGITSSSQTQLLDVLISADRGAVLDSQYASTPAKDPLTAQIASFVDKTGVIGFVAGLPLGRGEALAGPGRTVATTYAVARPILPLARAELRVRDTLVVPGSVSSLTAESAKLKERLSTRDVRGGRRGDCERPGGHRLRRPAGPARRPDDRASGLVPGLTHRPARGSLQTVCGLPRLGAGRGFRAARRQAVQRPRGDDARDAAHG
jgi:hypothetical protein